MKATARIVAFPMGRPALVGVTRTQIAWGRAQLAIGRLLNRLRVPALMREVDVDDRLSGLRLAVRIGPLFTRVEVNGRDFYFDRLTGRFDGTGSGCA